ncbi:hypothetical protein H2198_003174 [Neophaeococcomyces mojaviensis]|uniref:Uncharacterized protein n=1 Tax=Neophaeococcomyces mojaviensis TaxID=3383035 RepID=A0ACC3ABX5_9EURO|nr:hypothetical protein H2198_003174 [Knufia sp. JES_112]
MRSKTVASRASALLLLVTAVHSKHGAHEHLEALHRRHRENRARRINESGTEEFNFELAKRGGQCQFPTDAGLVAVTPGSANGGWAMSPDQPCTPGSYCPYACPPGQVSMQWDPKATSYAYPQSMNGGLYCDNNGQISKPFPDKPYCQSTSSNIGVVNNAGGTVAFCQTVLPGNEAMLIPTSVDSYATLANPGTDYWCGTAAHYYINPPGTSAADACVWGSSANPLGNWSPYVAGTNVDSSGETFVKLGWNPIYLESGTPFRNKMPTWGVKIECPNGGCSGLPCSIDPGSNKVNQMMGSGISNGAGGGAFCVVTVNKGATANFVVYSGSGGGGSSSSSGSSSSGSSSSSSSISSSSSATSSFMGPGFGKGGQFYASTASSSISTTTGATTTSTKASTTTTAELSSTTSSETVTTSVAETSTSTTWGIYNNSTTTAPSGPTGQPYYSLFNTTIPSTVAETGPVPTGPSATASNAKVPASTGAASQLGMGAVGFAVAFWSLLL